MIQPNFILKRKPNSFFRLTFFYIFLNLLFPFSIVLYFQFKIKELLFIVIITLIVIHLYNLYLFNVNRKFEKKIIKHVYKGIEDIQSLKRVELSAVYHHVNQKYSNDLILKRDLGYLCLNFDKIELNLISIC